MCTEFSKPARKRAQVFPAELFTSTLNAAKQVLARGTNSASVGTRAPRNVIAITLTRAIVIIGRNVHLFLHAKLYSGFHERI